jgi:molybdopterin molybdotransferase
MDGFAVRARDTFGASETLPALLELQGEVRMGEIPEDELQPGKAAPIPTGGMLPPGADAVVMVEYTSPLDESTIEVMKPAAPGDNALLPGEDVADGAELFPAGWRLRYQDVGMLAALGITRVAVHRKPRVAAFSTGDEVVPVDAGRVPAGKVRDVNGPAVAAQVRDAGGLAGSRALIADDPEALIEACRGALADHDVICLSGGSSVGVRDFTLSILDALPDSRLLVHGIAIRPGKPTILATVGERIFVGLPGHPVSAILIFDVFVRPLLARLEGERKSARSFGGRLPATLKRTLPSVHGREDYIRVTLEDTSDGLVASPIFGKSAMMSTLTRADGYVVVPTHAEGLDAGTPVIVHLFSAR